jgi:hypothetical protein
MDWEQFYYEMFKGAVPGNVIPSNVELHERATKYTKTRVLPIAVAFFQYDELVAGALTYTSDSSNGQAAPKIASPESALTTGRTFAASTLLPYQWNYFSLGTQQSCFEPTAYVIPEDFLLTNVKSPLTGLTIDFHDGQGAIPVSAGQHVTPKYKDAGERQITLTANCDGETLQSTFTVLAAYPPAPSPDESWTGLESTSFNGETATGHAWVYYGAGSNGKKHTSIVNPIIVSEGFPGNYCLNYLWWSLTTNACGLANTLLQNGMDVIILGYDVGTTYIEANAGVVQAAITKTISERSGNQPLVVGGACMGGVVVRYALAAMEFNNIDHQTSLYFSIDSPHMGINFPAGIQYALWIAEYLSIWGNLAYNALTSPAAQELVLYAVQSIWDGPAMPGDLRSQFVANLDGYGSFPKKCTKIGIADGNGNGTGNTTTPGVNTLEAGDYSLYSAPGSASDNLVFEITYDGLYWTEYFPGCPFSIDSAPGSTEGYFQQFASQVKQQIVAGDGDNCFVPTISAVSMSSLNIYSETDLYTNLTVNPPPASDLDAYLVNTQNSRHMYVDQTMANWLLSQLGFNTA